MKTWKIIPFIVAVLSVTNMTSCKKKVYGCTDINAVNYNPSATENDGSCKAKVYGCMDASSSNYNPSANIDNGTCKYTGDVTFWYNSSGSNATVTIGGKSGYITMYYPTYNPTCGSDGCANFTLDEGTYSYSASSTWSTWSGSITVTRNKCFLILLE